nr:MAG TPA: hypothetical protein [Caudoviricetes sp.]
MGSYPAFSPLPDKRAVILCYVTMPSRASSR